MEKPKCTVCAKPKATLTCEICQDDLCKYCAQFLDDSSFSFLATVPAELKHTTYCGPCFEKIVAPELAKYNAMMEKAKNINVYEKTQGKETRLIKRWADPVKVIGCGDREETLLRLAFFAAQLNYNAIIDVNITGEKIRNGTYQTQIWKGEGIPANVHADRLIQDRSLRQHPH